MPVAKRRRAVCGEDPRIVHTPDLARFALVYKQGQMGRQAADLEQYVTEANI